MAETRGSVLVVDDDAAVGAVLVALLQQHGYRAEAVDSARAALERAGARSFDLVISDLAMPEMDGLALLRELGRREPELPVVLLTAHGSVPLAVEAMREGAADFVLKPFDRDEIALVVDKALCRSRAALPPARPTAGASWVGQSAAMRGVLATVQKAALGTATVLIRGETGTGKELVARAIHEQSPRRDGPFVILHAAALPDSLLESELFGHEKGAFTGASARKPGRIELAHGGTLFLDEVGEIPAAVQVKLLRVLQERAFERLGGERTLKVDVRFVAATHRPLERMVERGEFREDLFYRLNVVPIEMPPLRERREDVPVLVEHFVRALGAENGKPRTSVAPDAIELLAAESWPGNVRQLQNLVERLIVLGDGDRIEAADVRRELGRAPFGAPGPGAPSAATTLSGAVHEVERARLLDALARARNNRSLAARLLDVSRRTLYNKLREHGIE